MSMRPEIYKGGAYLVDTPEGIFVVPEHVSGKLDLPANEIQDPDTCESFDECREVLQDYVGVDAPWNWIEYKQGYVGRYSMPGFLDATDWTYAETKEELEKELNDMYGEE